MSLFFLGCCTYIINLSPKYEIEKIINNAEYYIYETNSNTEGGKINDLEGMFGKIREYLDKHKICYSIKLPDLSSSGSEINNDTFIIVYGIKIRYHKNELFKRYPPSLGMDKSYIYFRLSMYNFEKTFSLLKELLSIADNKHSCLEFHVKSSYDCLVSEEDISSIISERDDFKSKAHFIEWFEYSPYNLKFQCNQKQQENTIESFISVAYSPSDSEAKYIISLIDQLCELGVIFKKSQELSSNFSSY